MAELAKRMLATRQGDGWRKEADGCAIPGKGWVEIMIGSPLDGLLLCAATLSWGDGSAPSTRICDGWVPRRGSGLKCLGKIRSRAMPCGPSGARRFGFRTGPAIAGP